MNLSQSFYEESASACPRELVDLMGAAPAPKFHGVFRTVLERFWGRVKFTIKGKSGLAEKALRLLKAASIFVREYRDFSRVPKISAAAIHQKQLVFEAQITLKKMHREPLVYDDLGKLIG